MWRSRRLLARLCGLRRLHPPRRNRAVLPGTSTLAHLVGRSPSASQWCTERYPSCLFSPLPAHLCAPASHSLTLPRAHHKIRSIAGASAACSEKRRKHTHTDTFFPLPAPCCLYPALNLCAISPLPSPQFFPAAGPPVPSPPLFSTSPFPREDCWLPTAQHLTLHSFTLPLPSCNNVLIVQWEQAEQVAVMAGHVTRSGSG